MNDNSQANTFRRPRFVVSKLLFGVALAYLAATVAGYLGWRDHAQTLLQAEIDAIHARGEPVMPWEVTFCRQPLPPKQNAFTLYKQAAEALEAVTKQTARPSMQLLDTTPAWRREHADETTAFLRECQPVLDLIRQARGMDGVAAKEYSLQLRGYYTLARLCHQAVVAAHDAGDDREAFEWLVDLLQLRDLLGEQPNGRYPITAAFRQLAVGVQAAECVEQMGTLKIGDGPGEVDPATVRAAALRLMQTDHQLATFRNALILDRAWAHELIRSSLQGGGQDVTNFYLSADPFIDTNCLWLLRWSALTIRRIESRYTAPNFSPDELPPNDPGYAEWMAKRAALTMTRSYEYAVPAMYRDIASQRMAGLALLMRVYEAETGRPVESLDDLVPVYLPTLPEDPFSPTGQPPRYIPDGPYPRLYCLNTDQLDDGGDYGWKSSPYEKYGREKAAKDCPFFLKANRGQAEGWASTQPAPAEKRCDEPQQQEAAGNAENAENSE